MQIGKKSEVQVSKPVEKRIMGLVNPVNPYDQSLVSSDSVCGLHIRHIRHWMIHYCLIPWLMNEICPFVDNTGFWPRARILIFEILYPKWIKLTWLYANQIHFPTQHLRCTFHAYASDSIWKHLNDKRVHELFIKVMRWMARRLGKTCLGPEREECADKFLPAWS